MANVPVEYGPEVVEQLLAYIAEGMSVRAACREEGMPAPSTVFTWLRRYEEFAEQYARAKEEAADALFDECLDIADDATNDWMARRGKEGEIEGYDLNGEHVQRSRLRIDTRKWAASKLKPKKYGDLVRQEISGPDGRPLGIDPTDVEIASRIAAILDAANRRRVIEGECVDVTDAEAEDDFSDLL